MMLSPQQRVIDRFIPEMCNHPDPLAYGLESHRMRSGYTSRRMTCYLGKCETNPSRDLSAWSDGVIASIGGRQEGKASMLRTEVAN